MHVQPLYSYTPTYITAHACVLYNYIDIQSMQYAYCIYMYNIIVLPPRL